MTDCQLLSLTLVERLLRGFALCLDESDEAYSTLILLCLIKGSGSLVELARADNISPVEKPWSSFLD